jgi:hypothetical protein
VAAGGGTAMLPCITDQATTAHATNCRQKAAETLWRRAQSRFGVAFSLSAIDYTCANNKSGTVPER